MCRFSCPVGVISILMVGDSGEGKEIKCAVADYIIDYLQHVWKFDLVLFLAQRQATTVSLVVMATFRSGAT